MAGSVLHPRIALLAHVGQLRTAKTARKELILPTVSDALNREKQIEAIVLMEAQPEPVPGVYLQGEQGGLGKMRQVLSRFNERNEIIIIVSK